MELKLPLKKNNKSNAKKTEKEKVEERREEVLARGRKFKYPLQYAKHKLMINTIIISVVAAIMLTVAGWVALYKVQDMGDIMYRISGVLQVPVAKIDGENVRFYDYLMMARSSLTTLEQQSGFDSAEEDKDAIKKRYKRLALTQVEDLTYAMKLGKELGLEVTSEEVEESFNNHKKLGGADRSEESFIKVLNTNFGLSKKEYERMLYLALMKAKVEQKIDDDANKIASEVEAKLAGNGGDFGAVKDEMGDKIEYENTGGLIDNKNVDSGRSEQASKMNIGEISGRILSSNGDGYYFVKTLDKTEAQVSYESIFVRFTEFDKRLAQVRDANKVEEYIDLVIEE